MSRAAVAVATAGAGGLLLRDVRDQRLGRQDHRRDRGRVLEGGPRHLAGVHDPLLEHVAVLAAERVVAVADLGLADLVDDDLAGLPGVVGDLAGRGLEGLADDVDADLGVTLELERVERRDGPAGAPCRRRRRGLPRRPRGSSRGHPRCGASSP